MILVQERYWTAGMTLSVIDHNDFLLAAVGILRHGSEKSEFFVFSCILCPWVMIRDRNFQRTMGFWAKPQNLPVSTEFLLNLQNFAELGNFRAHSVDLPYHLIDLCIIPIDESSNCTKINRLLHSLLTVFTYGTICSLCKVYLEQSMDFTCANFCLHHGLFTCGINCIVSK